MNLALQDQAIAVRWVQDYIGLFGGNPVGLSVCFVRFVVTKLEQENITIGGQSAGAIYTHGLLAMNVRSRRAILASGSLYLTPPQDRRKCFKVLRFIELSLRLNRPQDSVPSEQTGGGWLLRTAPAEEVVKIIQDAGIYSWWMFDSPLGHWKDNVRTFGNVEAVLLSDCKEEGMPYDSRLRRRTKEEIIDAFQTLPEPEFVALASAYGFEATQREYEKCIRMTTTFINDARFALWPQEIWNQINSAKGKAYLRHYDEVNPFGPRPTLGYPVAHHAVDLLAASGGYDDEVNAATREAGRLLRGKWIEFINGEEPWASDVIYCIGPDG